MKERDVKFALHLHFFRCLDAFCNHLDSEFRASGGKAFHDGSLDEIGVYVAYQSDIDLDDIGLETGKQPEPRKTSADSPRRC